MNEERDRGYRLACLARALPGHNGLGPGNGVDAVRALYASATSDVMLLSDEILQL